MERSTERFSCVIQLRAITCVTPSCAPYTRLFSEPSCLRNSAYEVPATGAPPTAFTWSNSALAPMPSVVFLLLKSWLNMPFAEAEMKSYSFDRCPPTASLLPMPTGCVQFRSPATRRSWNEVSSGCLPAAML